MSPLAIWALPPLPSPPHAPEASTCCCYTGVMPPLPPSKRGLVLRGLRGGAGGYGVLVLRPGKNHTRVTGRVLACLCLCLRLCLYPCPCHLAALLFDQAYCAPWFVARVDCVRAAGAGDSYGLGRRLLCFMRAGNNEFDMRACVEKLISLAFAHMKQNGRLQGGAMPPHLRHKGLQKK